MNGRSERAGERIGERILVKSLLLRYFYEDGKRCMEEAGEIIWGGGRGLVGDMSLRVKPQKREQKKRASKISLQSSLKLKKAATYSPALHCSTIGADGLNFSVRNGKRWNPDAITT